MNKNAIYIPREIKSLILKKRVEKKNLWRLVHDQMSNIYSIFTITDYFHIVKYILSEQNETIETSLYTSEYFVYLENKWMDILENEFNKFLIDIDGFSKIIFVLTVLENIQNKRIFHNKFYLSIFESYNLLWRKNKPNSIKTVPNFYKIIITLNECDFYKIKLVDGGTLNVSSQKKRIWDKEMVFDYIEYSYFDDELFDLIYRDTFRTRLRQLISIYINAFDKIH